MRDADLLLTTLSDVLDLSVAELDDDSDLLCLGLDSMRTMRAASQLRRAGFNVKFSTLIGKRTLGDWRREISGWSACETKKALPSPVEAESFDLATMQHAFWIGRGEDQQFGGVAAHFYAEFDGNELDPDRLAAATGSLIQRHPQLRLQVSSEGRQRITSAQPVSTFRVHDLRDLAASECRLELERLRDRYSHQTLRVDQGEVLMVALSRLPGARSRLHIDLDMIAGDAVSLRIILRELALLYRRPDGVLPALGTTYRAYLKNEASARAADRERDRAWWHARLDNLAPPPSLPLRGTRDGDGVARAARQHYWLSPEKAGQLHKLCRQYGITATVALTSLFAETVGLWSGGIPFVLNLPVFARHSDRLDIDGLVGDFSSSVLVTIEPGHGVFAERAVRLQERLHEAIAHSAYSGVEVLRELTRRKHGQQVLAPVVFTSALGLGDLYEPSVRDQFGEPVWSISQGPQVWLDAQLTDYAGGILVNWDVRDDAFIEGIVAEMFGHFRAELDRVLGDAKAWQRPLCSPPPLVPFTPQTVALPPNPEVLSDRFFLYAASAPDAAALLWGEHGRASYAELADQALRIAGSLRARNVRQGDSVAITMEKGPLQIAAVLGVLAAGATYVPCGIDVPPMRRDQIYHSAGARLVLVGEDDYRPAAAAVIRIVDALDGEPLVQPVAMSADQPMYVIFTSGSTGVPKGVEVSHRAVANTIDAVNRRFGIDSAERTLTLSELDFDLSAYDIFAFLAYGGSLVVVQEWQRRDAEAWLCLIRRWRVSIISCVPALLDMLLTAAASDHLPELRLVMLGGDRILPELAQRWWRATGDATFVGLGGMTEAAIHSTVHPLNPGDTNWAVVPYGRPLDNMSCRVVDHLGRDCPTFVAGELWVSGPGVAIGYRGDPDRTAIKFVTHSGRRWYRSGDQVRYRPDGVIEFLGRADNQVKIRGHRIELGEVEAVLSAHPAVEQALVVLVTPAARQLCALVIMRDGRELEELRGWMQIRLPRYAVPEHVLRVPHFPLTANGKIDRKALTEQAEQALRGEAVPRGVPQGEIEQRVSAIWCSLLSVAEIGRHDNFFALGGDSLIATRLISELRQAGMTGRLADLFSKPELAAFCATLGRADGAEETITANDDKRFEPFALTDIQRAFWIGRAPQLPLGGVGSHFYVEFEGDELDIDRLEQAWRRLVDHHDMLRAVVTTQGQQHVLKTVPPYAFRRHQLTSEEVEAGLNALRYSLSHACYDPMKWPLFDIQSAEYQTAEGKRQRLFVSLDSMMLDGRSIMILFTEWDRLYHEPGADLPVPKLRFRDYVNQYRRDPTRMTAAQTYWQAQIPSLPDAPALPLRAAPEALRNPRFRRLEATLDPQRWQRFRQRAREHGLTPSVALAAAYGEVLGYWSNQSELAINLTLFDRPRCHEAIDQVVGDFASILLLGYRSAGRGAFADAARRLQQQEGEGLSHRDVSGVWVLRELARHKGQPMATMPVVFTSVLGLPRDASMDLSPEFPRQVHAVTQTPQVWLDAKVSETRGSLSLEWDGVDALFPDRLLDEMFASYCGLVEHLADVDWTQPADLDFPTSQKLARAKVNATERVFADSRPLYLRVFDQAVATPTTPVLVWGENETMDYATLASRALQVAGYLGAQGIRPGDRIAITHAKGPDQIVAVLGILAAGGCYVPSGIDLPEARRALVYANAEVRLVLTDDDSLGRLAWPNAVPIVPLSTALTGRPRTAPVEQPGDASKYIIFTSGSTGAPKGVAVSHSAVANTVDAVAEIFDITSSDRTITLSALDFDLSAYDLFAFLSRGASVVVVAERHRRDAAAWVALINRWRVTVISAVPALVEMIAIASDGLGEGAGLCSELRLVMVGGDRVTRGLPDALWRHAPGARFAALGGMTEAAIHSTCYEISHQDPAWACAPYGRPLANMRCRVVDAYGRDCPDWVKGELWVAGRGLAIGYHSEEDRTRDKFVIHAGDRWYRTGDVARYTCDGILEFLGRADNQVKIRGHRIELAEIEGALAALPGIAASVAVVLTGAAAKLGAAVIGSKAMDLKRIKTALREVLPDYEVPEHLLQIESFPLTANGKIDRPAIAAQISAAVAGDFAGQRLPAGPAEEVVAALWSELLGRSVIGADDNFFALGGDSLVATRLMTQLHARGFQGALAALFTHPQLSGFAATLVAGVPTAARLLSADEAGRYDPFPLTEVQEAYWLGRRDDFELGGIGAQCYVEYDLFNLDIVRLEGAWATLNARHDMLRCVIEPDGQQRVVPLRSAVSIAVHDLGCDDPLALAATREAMSRRMLSVDRGPLVELLVIRQGETRCRLAVLFDNLAVDGLSMLTLLDELFQLYEDPARELPPIGIRFRDYALMRAHQGVSKRALDYWRERLAALPPAPALPTRIDPAKLAQPRFARLEARFPSGRWANLSAKAREANLTPSVLLLACFSEILSRWSGQAELVVNLTLFDRPPVHPDINRVVGDFTSLILAAYRAKAGESWLDRVTRLQAQIWQDLDHQDVSAVRVLREIAIRDRAEVRPVPIVFTSMLGVADTLAKSTRWPDVTRSQTPQVWLDHQVIELADGLLLSWDHVEELFPTSMIAEMFDAYQALLNELTDTDWKQPICRTIPEAQRLVRDQVNATAQAPSISDTALHQAFFRQASVSPQRRALWAPDTGDFSYGSLSLTALSIAGSLIRHGVAPGDKVGICCARGGAQIAAVLGVLAAGAAYVPINPDYPSHRQSVMCAKAAIRVVLADHKPELGPGISLCSLPEAMSASPLAEPRPVPADALAYVIFTSGSTGEPKGVEVEHRSALNTVSDVGRRFAIAPEDVLFGVSALDFDLSVFDIFGALSLGASLVLTAHHEQRDVERWLQLLAHERVTVWNSVPALLEMTLTMAASRRILLPALRLVLLSGDWVASDVASRLIAVASNARVFALGGATEASIWSNIWLVGLDPPDGWTTVPYGFPLHNQQFRVVDPLGADAPDWVPGELWIGGQGVARGYSGDIEQTGRQFSGSYPQRLYRTGDMGRYRPDGVLEFLGRRDGQVKVRGHRVELGEIEQVLQQHLAVRQAVVIVDGEGERARLLAFVTREAEKAHDGDADNLRGLLRDRLPAHMVPDLVVPISAFPLTPNGKLDRRSLAALKPQIKVGSRPVAIGLEAEIAEIWREFLEVAPSSADDSFFALGGNSLLATRLVARLSERFGVVLSLREFFTNATLSGVAGSVEARLSDRIGMEEGAI